MTSNVLIVEDEPNIADALRFILVHAGFDVAVERDGARVVETLGRRPFDVMILDVMLPNRSGYDVLRDVRAGTQPGLPVLMLTAKGRDRDRQTAEDLGVSAFITKPFSNAEVVQTVRRLAGVA
ncbi:MAG: response regulator [Pseudomonadota bacterium]